MESMDRWVAGWFDGLRKGAHPWGWNMAVAVPERVMESTITHGALSMWNPTVYFPQ